MDKNHRYRVRIKDRHGFLLREYILFRENKFRAERDGLCMYYCENELLAYDHTLSVKVKQV